jgi:hypothetical protein
MMMCAVDLDLSGGWEQDLVGVVVVGALPGRGGEAGAGRFRGSGSFEAMVSMRTRFFQRRRLYGDGKLEFRPGGDEVTAA